MNCIKRDKDKEIDSWKLLTQIRYFHLKIKGPLNAILLIFNELHLSAHKNPKNQLSVRKLTQIHPNSPTPCVHSKFPH